MRHGGALLELSPDARLLGAAYRPCCEAGVPWYMVDARFEPRQAAGFLSHISVPCDIFLILMWYYFELHDYRPDRSDRLLHLRSESRRVRDWRSCYDRRARGGRKSSA